MKRRHFIHAAAASVLLPAAKPSLGALATLSIRWDYAFFDERFQSAHRVAATWSTENEPIPVQSDITALWSNGLDRLARRQTLNLRGVTTASFHFCLKVLLSEHANLDALVSRLDRNLLLWRLLTTPKAQYGNLHG